MSIKHPQKFASGKLCVSTSRPIVSLTSYPARINQVQHTIKTLLSQSFKPEKVILWLSPEEFPKKEKELPKPLTSLVSKGLVIEWCDNIKSYKKLIPTLKKYPQYAIVTADDDILYPEDWLQELWDAFLKHPECVIAHRIHQFKFTKDKKIAPYNTWPQNISCSVPLYQNFLTGSGGVLYPPFSLHPDVLKEDLFTKLCAKQDDVWFWAMALLNRTKIKQVDHPTLCLQLVENTQETALCHENCGRNALNDKAILAIMKKYPVLRTLLATEKKPLYLYLKPLLKKIFSIHITKKRGGGKSSVYSIPLRFAYIY